MEKTHWKEFEKGYFSFFKCLVWIIIILSILTLLICSPILIICFLIVAGILITIKILIQEIKEW